MSTPLASIHRGDRVRSYSWGDATVQGVEHGRFPTVTILPDGATVGVVVTPESITHIGPFYVQEADGLFALWTTDDDGESFWQYGLAPRCSWQTCTLPASHRGHHSLAES